MSCIDVTLQRVGSSVELERKAPSLMLERISSHLSISRLAWEFTSTISRDTSHLSLEREQSEVFISRVCSISRLPYLEIEPTMIWVYPDFESSNDVLSNTDWFVD